MARAYANIFCAIWDDPEFLSLSAGAQRTYFMLVTQTDITACGSLALTLRRWSKTCTDSDLSTWLVELTTARFVLVDEDTEELIVRTFVKHDGGYKHAKRVLAVIATAKAIRSRVLRQSLAGELAKLGLSLGDTLPPDTQSNANAEATEVGRVVVTEVSTNHNPETTTLIQQPASRVPAESATTAQTIVAEWIERTPKRPPGEVVGQIAKRIDQMLAEGIDPDDIRRGLAAWMTKGLHPSTLPSVVNEVMNSPGMRPASGRRTTDDKVRDHLALAERLAAEELGTPHREISA